MHQSIKFEEWEILLKRAENGDCAAQYEIYPFYESGLIINGVEVVKPDGGAAFELIKKSAESGHLEAQVDYADWLSVGKCCDQNIELAIQLYEDAIGKGHGRAALNLGVEYVNKQDYDKAFELYNLAQQLDPGSYDPVRIGLCHYYGIGTKKDKPAAFKHFEQVREHEHTGYEVDEANYLIGKMYLDGEVVEQSLVRARQYLELADRDGDHRSAQEILTIIGRTK